MLKVPLTYKTSRLKNGQVSLIDASISSENLKEDTLIIKLMYMGICRADVKEVTGSRDIPEDRGPLFGHEFIGKIVFSGRQTSFKEGETVTFNPNISPNRTTGFAEYFIIHGDKNTLEKAVIKLPESILIVPPWLPEPFACIVHSTKKLLELTGLHDFKSKQIAIIGIGNSGLMFGLYVKYLGGKVLFFNRGQMRIDFTLRQKLFANSELKKLENYNNYKDHFDIVIVVPTKTEPEILQKASYIVKNKGGIHLYSGTRKGDTFLSTNVDIDHIRRSETKRIFRYGSKTITLTGAYGCETKDYEVGFDLYKNRNDSFPLQKLISKEITLIDFPQIVTKIASGEVDFPGKVLVKA